MNGLVGEDRWPRPMPRVRRNDRWAFDRAAQAIAAIKQFNPDDSWTPLAPEG
jgi:hypothetical protein